MAEDFPDKEQKEIAEEMDMEAIGYLGNAGMEDIQAKSLEETKVIVLLGISLHLATIEQRLESIFLEMRKGSHRV